MLAYSSIDELLAKSRQTAARSHQLIAEARRIREQTRQLRLTMGDLVAERRGDAEQIGPNGSGGEPSES